jgi:aspartokinase
VPDRPGVAATIFSTIADANIVVDDIIQNVMDDNTANISFTVEHGDLHDIKPVVDRLVKELGGGSQAIYNSDLAKVSVVGVGMRPTPASAQRMFKALATRRSTSRTSPRARSRSAASSAVRTGRRHCRSSMTRSSSRTRGEVGPWCRT